ncbi:MAG: hypothetical protein P1P76_04560 [Anaerolineales bacterium]|nr:hypothetical protein [Anaerolineales bacterium]
MDIAKASDHLQESTQVVALEWGAAMMLEGGLTLCLSQSQANTDVDLVMMVLFLMPSVGV